MKRTKKEFKEWLNKKYGFTGNTVWNKKAKPSKRLFGDYLYSSDKGYFDMWYNEWKQGAEL